MGHEHINHMTYGTMQKCDVFCRTQKAIHPQSVRFSPDILENIALLLMFGLKFRRLLCVDVFQGDCGLHLREKKFARHQTHYSSMLEATRKSKKLLLYLPFEEADSFCISSHFATKQAHYTHTVAQSAIRGKHGTSVYLPPQKKGNPLSWDVTSDNFLSAVADDAHVPKKIFLFVATKITH